tara:strand:+ start:2076 stop:2714 length:639 start_codon:yes stop_codon:yes gene_type:complete
MHSSTNIINILCLADTNFKNSLIELKSYLKFKLKFSKNNQIDSINSNLNALMVHENVLKDKEVTKFLKSTQTIKILLAKPNYKTKLEYDDRIDLPLSINELNKKIIEFNVKKKFFQNSFVEIKNYILDKNEKKLKKDKLFIMVTEKEIELLELLLIKKTPVKKEQILEKVWKYSSDADTHTVETHIYRLRKKISDKFNDNKLILNTKNGYSI